MDVESHQVQPNATPQSPPPAPAPVFNLELSKTALDIQSFFDPKYWTEDNIHETLLQIVKILANELRPNLTKIKKEQRLEESLQITEKLFEHLKNTNPAKNDYNFGYLNKTLAWPEGDLAPLSVLVTILKHGLPYPYFSPSIGNTNEYNTPTNRVELINGMIIPVDNVSNIFHVFANQHSSSIFPNNYQMFVYDSIELENKYKMIIEYIYCDIKISNKTYIFTVELLFRNNKVSLKSGGEPSEFILPLWTTYFPSLTGKKTKPRTPSSRRRFADENIKEEEPIVSPSICREPAIGEEQMIPVPSAAPGGDDINLSEDFFGLFTEDDMDYWQQELQNIL